MINIKLIAIVFLVLFAFFALIQIESIAGLNPILYSMAASIRYLVTLVFQLQTTSENQVLLKGEHQFLSPTDETKVVPSTVSAAKYKQRLDQMRESGPSNKDVNLDFLFNAIESELTHPATANGDEEIIEVLGLAVELEDPITNLFLETEWYDTGFNFDDVYYDEFWQAELETSSVPTNDDFELNQIEGLLEEFPDPSEINQLDVFDQK